MMHMRSVVLVLVVVWVDSVRRPGGIGVEVVRGGCGLKRRTCKAGCWGGRILMNFGAW
jgi:hypothetical protein